jgi:YidC/Oxa1 family membrane protein insertase
MLANIFQPLIDVAEAILRFFHDSLGFSWGWSIVGLTVVVRLAILPLTFKQVRSMQAMQRLQPEMKKLQERYKEDRQRLNEELMKLYRENQVNPLGSCLPLLLQLPFFLSLFYLQQSEGFRALVRDTGGAIGVLSGGGRSDAASQITGGEEFLFIPDITQAATGGVLVALILIYICTQLGSSTVSAMAMTDKNQKRLMFALPFIFVPFIVSFPAGLMVYWITTNVWTVGQQLLIRKVLPPPHLTDDKNEESTGDAQPRRGLGRVLAAASAGSGRAQGRDGGSAGGTAAKEKRAARASSGTEKQRGGDKQRSGGAKASAAKKSGGTSDGAGAKQGGGGNGRAQKAPPPSPRKKKKRSGRRR